MSRIKTAGVAVVVAALFAPNMALAQDDPAFGLWLTENQRAIVEIGPCDAAPAQACGVVVWLLEPTDASGAPRVDTENPEASLRTRPLCGLPVVGDFERQGPGSWDDGFIYDGAEGDTYTASMEVQGDGTLRVRGYVLVSAIGRSQTWTRVEDDRGGC